MILLIALSNPITSYNPPHYWCDYFQMDTCPYYRHCYNASQMLPEFTDYPLNQDIRDLIMYTINRGRSPIACGEPSLWNFNFEIFPKAAKMPEIVWDDQLAWAASANVIRCDDRRMAGCLKTADYPTPGNLILDFLGVDSPWDYYDLMGNCRTKIMDYFNAYLQFRVEGLKYFNEETYLHISNTRATQKYFDIYDKMPYISAQDVKKFALLISDQVSRIGCAAADCGHVIQIECAFDGSIHYGSQIYATSMHPAESCNSSNWKYSCLCGLNKESPPPAIKPKRKTKINLPRVKSASRGAVEPSCFVVFLVLTLYFNKINGL